uniref:Uncharacterized protein n=1 Tax=Anguilla anguilla TaxID=7936 RepID=A0A0E9XW55_ANGAN
MPLSGKKKLITCNL